MRGALSCVVQVLLATVVSAYSGASLAPLARPLPAASGTRFLARGDRPRRAATVVAVAEAPPSDNDEPPTQSPPPKAVNYLLGASILGTFAAMVLHSGTFIDFYDQWETIGEAGVSGDEFWAPFQFWLFFAAMHPILQPVLWISEVLHGSPGPKIGDILPYSFLLGNVVAIGALQFVPRLRTAVNIALLGLFINYVGTGLEGTNGLGDYNLALNDGVKGCPAYEQVRQPSMDGFDKTKYTGRWYEHAFHDWTQFSDTYDVTLDIELSPDKERWLDDFGLRGPAPLAAPRSWDKSPVANGAHYFLYGRFDPQQAGVLQESGFGVTFPNYIVDAQKGADGQYSEAIQFQCLERGGVRIFEGINFLTRSPTMSDEARAAMFARAAQAGIAPYGATPEQMHNVPHYPAGAPPIDNQWQQLWSFVGIDKLLGLLESASHSSFEDTSLGRDVAALRE